MNPGLLIKQYESVYLPFAIALSVLLSVIVGFFFGESMAVFAWLGDLFLNGLKMLIIPLIMSSMIAGVNRLGDIKRVGRIGLYTLIYYLITTGISVAIGLLVVNVLPFPHSESKLIGEKVAVMSTYSPVDVLLGMVPSNIFSAMAEMKVLPIIFFSLFFGIVLSTMGETGKPVSNFFIVMEEVFMRMVRIVILFSPVGIFGLITGKLASTGGGMVFLNHLLELRWYAQNVILGLSIHFFIVLPLILFLIGKRNPVRYLMGMVTALFTSFSTSSSSATLPVTMECAEDNNGISSRVSSFVLPLGATVNMDGTALYEAVAAMFIASVYGIDLSYGQQIVVLLTATLAAIGAAGIPEAGLVTMVLVLQAVHLPAEGIGLILAIDWFLDRLRTTVNVWGDAVGAAVIETYSGVKTSS